MNPFPRVKEARDALRTKALDILAKYELIIDAAIAKGDLETAGNLTKWLIEHMPAEEGVRMIDSSASKPIESAPTAPPIQIGVLISGNENRKFLPTAQIIDITPDGTILPEETHTPTNL